MGWWFAIMQIRQGKILSFEMLIWVFLALLPIIAVWEVSKRIRHPVEKG